MHTSGNVFITSSSSTETWTTFSYGYSGILIAKRWVLAHGSILTSIVNRSGKLYHRVATLNPGELILFGTSGLVDDLTLLIHRGRSSIESGKLVAAWKCPLLKDTLENLFESWKFQEKQAFDRLLLPTFLMIECGEELVSEFLEDEDDRETQMKSKIQETLLRFAKETAASRLVKGSTVEIVSTPFGNAFFADTVSRGIVGNLLGLEECLILMDATVFPECEGSPVYLIDNRGCKSIRGMVIASLSWCRGEWVDYTFAVNLLPSLKQIVQSRVIRDESRCLASAVLPFTRWNNRNDEIDTLERSVVIVKCGPNWGTGVLLDERTGTFVTCAHVVAGAQEQTIELATYIGSGKDISHWFARAKLIYKTPRNRPYDVAVLRIDSRRKEPSLKAIKLADKPSNKGEPILSIGFPFSSKGRATVSNGVVSKISDCMLQANCCAQSGASGGPIVRRDTLEMIGMIVSNTVSADGSTLYPRLCMAIPVTVLKGPLNEYLRTTDPKTLEKLTQRDVNIEAAWSFRPFLYSNI
ncbi:peroxisomal leader peptide-processing protease-like [Hylaeus anthracinus]|uniref:peroxisomal leader peptide-processing protease-like n=1 Tax=Hylaeus anthracinus TaxID=313031 RepID=UPI0023B91404|nr:peroxisomal leader peptide-processing protease-like [Hylaeus anthracinus]XP_054014003.1 peroxisomal leader peptide-processing protease-like [Hylaeus anthracinus]